MNAAEGHSTLFAALRHAALTQEKGLLFVHAGVDPRRPLTSQGDGFWWGSTDILEMAAPFAEFRRVLAASGLKMGLEPIEKWDFYTAVGTPDHVLTIQTADQQRFANLLLSVGVRMD